LPGRDLGAGGQGGLAPAPDPDVRDGVPGLHARGAAEIKSEELFSGEAPAYERLMAVLPIDDLSKEMFEENFAKTINKKDTMVDESAAGLVDEKGFGKFLLELEQNGHFGG